jgi:hypothetical protein
MSELRVDLLQLFVDDVEAFDWRQRVAQPGEPRVRTRRDERVDLAVVKCLVRLGTK